MTVVPTIVVSPSAAIDAYRKTASDITGNAAPTFSDAMEQSLAQAVHTGHVADDQAVKAISGEGNLTEVVTALSRAEMTLQTVTAVRDRVVQAYQDIMKMPI